MSRARAVRRQARRWYDTLVAAGAAPNAASLLDTAERLTGVARVPVAAGDPLLDGAEALLDAALGLILFDADAPLWRAAFYQAHEYAHLCLDGGHSACTDADMDAGDGEEPQQEGGRVEGYGPHERRERDANAFALELLLPGHILGRWWLEEGLDAEEIAARVDLPLPLVLRALTRAVLLPPDDGSVEEGPPALPAPLDPSQEAAAHAPHGPLLVEAGPGTGKTRTLVGRVTYLLARGVAPDALLALTFSNRAAEEMRERVAAVAPAAAEQIWLGTFHAFGLELLRKYGDRLGLPPRPTLLDSLDVLRLLESGLADLDLRHYQSLPNPSHYLPDLLGAISRAKDELVGPEEYRELAEAMRARALTAEEVDAADRALEVAHVYAWYQARLRCDGLLDFGDLVACAVALLRDHPEVRATVRRTYAHVLVDEYQDMNRASGLLLREVAGSGAGLWVVGDARQAIYRFRGAAPANMRLFPSDFPGAAVYALRRNYRSRPEVVRVVAELAPRMRATAGTSFQPWEVQRTAAGGTVRLEVAADEQAEVAGMARRIARARADGVPYREQAVLCRSHTALARLAQGLRRAGVPTLYLGSLLQRAEARDLLALLSLAGEGDGHGLLRVARFPEYAVPLADIRALLELASQRGVSFPRALGLAEEAALSPTGRRGLTLLQRHLEGLCHGVGAWSLLARYLFCRSSYLRRLTGEDGGAAGRLALAQLLRCAEDAGRRLPADAHPLWGFLRYLRWVAALGEDRALGALPEGDAGLDGVRMLTMHAAKGLEFSCVYLPLLGQRFFPAPRQAQPCPPPVGMLAASDEAQDEEECLLFVALSRARDTLVLSRAQRYGRQNSRPSALLALIAGALPGELDGPVTWLEGASGPAREAPPLPDPGPAFEADTLDLYLRCPRRYYYERELGMVGRPDDSAYAWFHHCVRAVLRWVGAESEGGQQVTEAAALGRLAALWAEGRSHDHPYTPLYRRQAEDAVRHALARALAAPSGVERPTWEVVLPSGRVRVRPDYLEVTDDLVVARRLRAGGATAREARGVYALYDAALEGAYPAARRRIESLTLADDELAAAPLTPRTRATELAHYDAAMAGIRQGHFDPAPESGKCPRCPHYFICSADPGD